MLSDAQAALQAATAAATRAEERFDELARDLRTEQEARKVSVIEVPSKILLCSVVGGCRSRKLASVASRDVCNKTVRRINVEGHPALGMLAYSWLLARVKRCGEGQGI